MQRWVCAVFLAASLLPALAQAGPFSTLTHIPARSVSLGGKTLLVLEDGDYVLPRFSPDSQFLAFSRVVLQGAIELTEIHALDLKSLKVKNLLNAKASLEFAIHKSFVSGFSWLNTTRLQAAVSDGDVNGVNLVFDVAVGRLVEKKSFAQSAPVSKPEKVLTPEQLAAFSSIPEPVLQNAIQSGYEITPKQFVVQKNYWKQDSHIWWLDAEHRKLTKLIELPEDWIYSLRGAFAFDSFKILLLAYGPDAWLMRSNGNRLELLHHLRVQNYQQTALRILHRRADRILFQVITGPEYEKRENRMFVYDQTGLQMVKESAPFFDVDVDRDGKHIALSQWHSQRRKLVVRELSGIR